MKFIKSLLLAVGLGAALAASAQDGTPVFKAFPLINGFNVLCGTNDSVGYANTNNEFTTLIGQIWYSFNGITNQAWTGNTNALSSFNNVSAFQPAELKGDFNGDINANASLWIYVNNTNFIPVAAFSNYNSLAAAVISTNWPLAAGTWTVGTNTYPQINGGVNTPFTITLYSAPSSTLPPSTGTLYPWESASSFSATFTPSGGPQIFSTNLPTVFLQHARFITMTMTNVAASGGKYVLLNQALIVQPQK